MDNKEDHIVISMLHSDEKTNNKILEKEEEGRPLHATLDEREMKEKIIRPLCHGREPEVLESVQKYASRIKSFLGWDPDSEETKLESGLKDSITDRSLVPGAENSRRNCENHTKDEDNDSEKIQSNETLSRKLVEMEEKLEKEDITKNTKADEVEQKIDEADPDAILEISRSSDSPGTEKRECIESDTISKYTDNENDGNKLQMAEEYVKAVSKYSDDIKDTRVLTDNISLDESEYQNEPLDIDEGNRKINKKSNIISDSKIEPSSIPENRSTGKSLVSSQNDVNKITFTDETITNDAEWEDFLKTEFAQESAILDENQNFAKPLPTLESDRNLENISLRSSELTGEVDEVASLENVKIDFVAEIENSDETSQELKRAASGAHVSITDHASETMNKNPDFPNNDIASRKIIPEVIKNGKLECDFSRGEGKMDNLNNALKNVPLRNRNIEPYLNEVKRISQDIVKEVIESARNSVHEQHNIKNEDLGEKNLSITSKYQNGANENSESHILNGKNCSEIHSNSDTEKVKDSSVAMDVVSNIPFDSAKDYEASQYNDLEQSDYKSSSTFEDSENVVQKDELCGYGCFKPKWIQNYSRTRVFLTIFSIIGVIHGCYYTYMVSIISTLEKRYAFKTRVSGTLLLADEVPPLIFGILVGYVGGRTHRPRMVAVGMFMAAACCFVSGLPYLMYGPAQHLTPLLYRNETGPEICEGESKGTICDEEELPPTLTVIGIFLVASFLKGFATLSYYVLGISYMDDSIKKKNSPMYLAIALALRLLGPLLGFLMSSGFLKLYENPLHDPGYGPEDPRWIGAWWIGFFLQGILLIVFTLPIGLFPRRLPGRKSLAKATSFTSENSLKEIFVGLVAALKRLGKNPVFVLLIINTTMKIFGHFGHAIMLPKYMENQFRLSASEASLFSGATSITCIMLSTLLGGFLVWKFRPRLQVLLSGMIASEIIMCVGFLILMIPRCKTANMLHFGMDDEGLILNSVCNNKCDCSTTSFTPFCGQDGETMYFSPCYAGCTEKLTPMMSPKKHKEFGNCSCVGSIAQQNIKTTITEGFCPDENCWSQTLAYLIILFLVIAISNLFTVVHTMILLRSVHPNDKSVALGTFETFICLFGFIPFPVTYGALVDSACLVWEKSCGETGNCWFYDMERYRYLLHGASALFCSFSVVCLVLLYFFRSRVRDLYDDDDENEVTGYVDIKLDTVSGSVTKL